MAALKRSDCSVPIKPRCSRRTTFGRPLLVRVCCAARSKSIDAFRGFAKTEAFEIFSAHKSAVAAIADVLIEHRR